MYNLCSIQGTLCSDVIQLSEHFFNFSIYTKITLSNGKQITEYFTVEVHGEYGKRIMNEYIRNDMIFVSGYIYTTTWTEKHKVYPIEIKRNKARLVANCVRNLTRKLADVKPAIIEYEELEEFIDNNLKKHEEDGRV